MDPIHNPFSPGAGSPPPELVGRDQLLEQARILLARIINKRSEKSMLLIGLRGVGKTVLLNEMGRIAKGSNYRILFLEAREDTSLRSLLVPSLRSILFDLDRIAGASQKVKRGIAVLRSFISGIHVTIGEDVTFGIHVEPEKGSADSGDLENDLPNLFISIGEAAEERKTGIAIVLDEIQYLSQKELGALIMAMHKMQQLQLPIVLFGAGLPLLPGLAGEAKSYVERLFCFPEIGALSEEEASRVIQEPARSAGVTFTKDALKEIYHFTKGYPYFLQEWGYQTWNLAKESLIDIEIVREASKMVGVRLDQNFFRIRFDRLAPSEKHFLRVMAELGPGPHRISDIAGLMNSKLSTLSPIRTKLIKKGMIYSPSYGDLAFTVPLFDDFMKRSMEFQKPKTGGFIEKFLQRTNLFQAP